ncbi:HesA/MoeB/ThiF family protein [Nonlabens xiamenensis]|uniref:HesA/MoeB/ThiF family protein n=1 Tax=Nonlabens xiamenensis TaxID=2341043 RepID=UPI000F60F007|nr:ThiF family adenylyltransferase [Nonlabens xiamenensis]
MHIKITENMHEELWNHLHGGDGLEAISFALCGRADDVFLVHQIYNIDYEKCKRTEDRVHWKTSDIEEILVKCKEEDFSIIKFHSHFIEDSKFSEYDDISDKNFCESAFGWNLKLDKHASVIMYPSGKMKGRVISPDLEFKSVKKFSIIGSDVVIQDPELFINKTLAFDRNVKAFGKKTTSLLNNLKIGVIGCSGTGSPTIEQLVRLGVEELILVDPDDLGVENMNRIYGSKLDDAVSGKPKVEVLKKHIAAIGLNTKISVFKSEFQNDKNAWTELKSCDFIFGCMDSVLGRHSLNLFCNAYLIPFIDIGVSLISDGKGEIDSITGNIHYLYPGSFSLLERGVYTSELLESESIEKQSPEEYKERQRYFKNADEPSPAVISVNTLCSSYGVNEFLSRLHPYRNRNNKHFDATVINLSEFNISSTKVGNSNLNHLLKLIGLGDLAKIHVGNV